MNRIASALLLAFVAALCGCASPRSGEAGVPQSATQPATLPPEVIQLVKQAKLLDGPIVGDETTLAVEHVLRFKSLTFNRGKTLRLRITKPADYQPTGKPYIVVLAVETLFLDVPQNTQYTPTLKLWPATPPAPPPPLATPAGADGGVDTGADGQAGQDGAIGAQGASGEDIEFYVLFQKIMTNNPAPSTGPFLRIHAQGEDGQPGADGSAGGSGGNGGRGTPSRCSMALVGCVLCEAGPGQGGWGAKGGHGGDGGRGGSGGRGPTLVVVGPELSVAGFFELQAPGGSGAKGGRGGSGGPGGAAGGGGYQCKCCLQGGPSGRPGEAGLAGINGSAGDPGANGSEQRGTRNNSDLFVP